MWSSKSFLLANGYSMVAVSILINYLAKCTLLINLEQGKCVWLDQIKTSKEGKNEGRKEGEKEGREGGKEEKKRKLGKTLSLFLNLWLLI